MPAQICLLLSHVASARAHGCCEDCQPAVGAARSTRRAASSGTARAGADGGWQVVGLSLRCQRSFCAVLQHPPTRTMAHSHSPWALQRGCCEQPLHLLALLLAGIALASAQPQPGNGTQTSALQKLGALLPAGALDPQDGERVGASQQCFGVALAQISMWGVQGSRAAGREQQCLPPRALNRRPPATHAAAVQEAVRACGPYLLQEQGALAACAEQAAAPGGSQAAPDSCPSTCAALLTVRPDAGRACCCSVGSAAAAACSPALYRAAAKLQMASTRVTHSLPLAAPRVAAAAARLPSDGVCAPAGCAGRLAGSRGRHKLAGRHLRHRICQRHPGRGAGSPCAGGRPRRGTVASGGAASKERQQQQRQRQEVVHNGAGECGVMHEALAEPGVGPPARFLSRILPLPPPATPALQAAAASAMLALLWA